MCGSHGTVTNAPRAVLAATFAPGDTAVSAARRFTSEVLTAWAAVSVLTVADRLVGRAGVAGRRRAVRGRLEPSGRRCSGWRCARTAPRESPGGPSIPVEEWGVTFAGQHRTHWARLRLPEFAGRTASEWSMEEPSRGPIWMGFLADASDLLAGTLDPDMVPAIISQIVVPRLATWCAVYTWTDGGGPQRPAYLWHTDERRIDELRRGAGRDPDPAGRRLDVQLGDSQMLVDPAPRPRARCSGDDVPGTARPVPRGHHPVRRGHRPPGGARHGQRPALRHRRRRPTGRCSAACCPRTSPARSPGSTPPWSTSPRGRPTRSAATSTTCSRRETTPGGSRWATSAAPAPRPPRSPAWPGTRLRLLSREGYGVAAVLDRLNQAILEEGERARFLTLLHGEITPVPTGPGRVGGLRRSSRGAAAAAQRRRGDRGDLPVAAGRLPRGDLQGGARPPRRSATSFSR